MKVAKAVPSNGICDVKISYNLNARRKHMTSDDVLDHPTASFTKPPAVERFTGFADIYDRYRPDPPEALRDLLCDYTHMKTPEVVIDLGCGTGISTRYWSARAKYVVGIDPTADMLNQARVQTSSTNTVYVGGFSQQVGLKNNCADILTISQAFHWMEPVSTLAEVARILRPGGVLAVYDHDDFPILPVWEMELALRAYWDTSHALDQVYQINAHVPRWPKSEHLKVIQSSGHFRFTREVHLHQVVLGNAEQLIGYARSYGYLQSLLKRGASADEIGLSGLEKSARHILGDELKPWYWTTRVLIGIR
jgi:ubiquinone/menaquinone biosynthesis C-methylase UbiE